ncbi:endolytic transglycosylase MltG [Leucobacter soli]|uniref:Endolytic murein transglycosylase n=1 Tax=Leucobacter soli TaxID=2812850 RepID=A0A916JR53_9MICO|nr:endolytic transglycosylase MltG [Leucobacter soli]CAG7595793.1 Endolytic murein transglycosylase [Leucobacter soli]
MTDPLSLGPTRAELRQKRRVRLRRILISLGVTFALLAGLGIAATALWSEYGDRVSQALGWTSDDYTGRGEGEVIVTIREGEYGEAIAATLADAGVVKSAQVFYELLLAQDPQVEFHPGSFALRKGMSAQAALDALQDPDNEVQLTVTVPEGMAAMDALERVSEVTGISMKQFKKAVKKPSDYGVPKKFPSIEGFLFPATYTFEPTDTAETVVQKMVDRMFQALDEHGVKKKEAWEVLTLASIVQREAGSDLDDFPKISRVFLNRLDIGMNLQSDATVAYGTGNTHTVWTTDEERADASNEYNTYANPGLPIGPVGLPGDVAIDAAVNPADGEWLFFMPVNLETGETVFSNTVEEHEVAVQRLAEWCTTHRDEGGTRCD